MPRPILVWTAAALVAVSLCAAPAAEAVQLAPDGTPASTVTTSPTTAPTPVQSAAEASGDVVVPDPAAPAPGGPRVLVFGDSISAASRYNAAGTAGRTKAWWAWVAQAAGVAPTDVMVSAEAGSGLVSRGGSANRLCTGTTFGQRLDEVSASDPDVIVVEVGRNDIWTCRGTRRVAAGAAERRTIASAYFAELARAADLQGVARSNVYVMTAWGSTNGTGQAAVTTTYEALARTHGFAWVPLPSLIRAHTVDGVHPTAAGAKTLATWAMRASDMTTAISSRGTSHRAAPAGANVRCTGLTACRKAGTKTYGYGKVTTRIWNAPARTDRHYVAHRLRTSGRKVTPILVSSTSRGWRRETVAAGTATQTSQPTVGAVAWWNDSPAGAGGSAGHVAVVERVAKDHSYVVVSEVTSSGVFRTVRYSGTSLPQAYLQFHRANGSPAGVVTSVAAKHRTITVTGRAVDTDRPAVGTRLRIKVTQGTRTSIVDAPVATHYAFSQRFTVPRLRSGPVTIKVIARNAPGSRGKARVLTVRTATVR